ncbi:uncharacterized protein LOC133781749 [Humulus lupulus]|uniref:uncharacterized protein LOC133781749 n=1 Tax=Humulus lupulus TaxID=3486 RepID=UPI002B413868|nr:uncharacterized protein LOC133781749 [Humulus lupulus]XP_062076803.1 uncharacterized protein LOC133781749 [Humulus lupulus]
MQLDVDPLDDLLSESKTNNSHKFRPKMKAQPRKGETRGVASDLPNLMDRPVLGSIQEDPLQSAVQDSLQSVDSLAMTEKSLSKESIFQDSLQSVESIAMTGKSHSIDPLHSEDVVPDGNGDWQSSFGKSLGENADIFSGLECLDDFITQTTSGSGSEASKSQSKVHMDEQHSEKFLTSYGVNNNVEGPISTSHMENRSEENLSAPAHHSFDSSSFTICDVAPSQICTDYHSTQDPVSFSKTAVSNELEEAQINDGRSKTMVAEDLFDFEMYEGTVASGHRVGKFQPKAKLGKGKKKPSTNEPQADVRSGVPLPAVHNVPLDQGYDQESSVLEFPSEGILDYSSATFDDSISLDPISEIQEDVEPTNLAKATHSEVVEDDPVTEEVDGKSKIGESSTEPNGLRRSKRSAAMQDIEGRESSKQQREDLRQLSDDPVDEVHDLSGSVCDPPCTSNRDEEEDNDEEYRVDSTSKKKKATRKVKEPVPGKEKPVRKRKSSKQASEEQTKEPPKKFPHSTRRKKRMVDKALLDMPEDEIDPLRLPIKDLILLAEHRERMATKDAAKLKTPQTNQSANDSFREDVSHNEEMFHSEQGQHFDEDQPTYRAQSSSTYVNYHSFMDKTPSTRWSKHDTELFYEAVRQMGTDFTIIQQLFPNRTREQVKLKFKKEERQHPLRLSDALTNRTKDHSHFESVIKRLQELAAQAKQEANGNESNWFPGEEEVEEPTQNANEEHTKSELDEVVKDQEQEAEVTNVQNSPLKYDEGEEDDPDRWNSYDDY